MFFVITQRLYKVSVTPGDQYSPRSANTTQWGVSGPFARRARAEGVAARMAGTHTCLSVEIVDAVQLERIARTSSFDNVPHVLQAAALVAVKRFGEDYVAAATRSRHRPEN